MFLLLERLLAFVANQWVDEMENSEIFKYICVDFQVRKPALRQKRVARGQLQISKFCVRNPRTQVFNKVSRLYEYTNLQVS